MWQSKTGRKESMSYTGQKNTGDPEQIKPIHFLLSEEGSLTQLMSLSKEFGEKKYLCQS